MRKDSFSFKYFTKCCTFDLQQCRRRIFSCTLQDSLMCVHLPYEERLQRRRPRGNLIPNFMIVTSLLDVDPGFFLPPTRRGLRMHPHKAHLGASHHQTRVHLDDVVTASSVEKFIERLYKSLTHLSHRRSAHLSNTLLPINRRITH